MRVMKILLIEDNSGYYVMSQHSTSSKLTVWKYTFSDSSISKQSVVSYSSPLSSVLISGKIVLFYSSVPSPNNLHILKLFYKTCIKNYLINKLKEEVAMNDYVWIIKFELIKWASSSTLSGKSELKTTTIDSWSK